MPKIAEIISGSYLETHFNGEMSACLGKLIKQIKSDFSIKSLSNNKAYAGNAHLNSEGGRLTSLYLLARNQLFQDKLKKNFIFKTT